jgi:glucose/arabinose dehydrogenase
MRLRLVAVVALAGLVLVAACQPVKKAPPTDGPALAIDSSFVTGLSNPWDIAFVPGDVNTMFFTQRHGPISVKRGGATPVQLLAMPPGSAPSGEGGVMGVAVDPNFATNRFIYVCYTHTADNRVVRFTVDPGFTTLTSPVDLVVGIQKASIHNGCRVRFGPDGWLWITTGDANNPASARNPDTPNGKVLRVNPANGNAAPGNPVAGNRFFTRGHRNPQGIAFRANGQVFTTEHGPDRDDEVNLLFSGGDYGWNGATMTVAGATPALWSSGVPTIAPSGATFVNGPQWKGWNGALVVAVLKAQRLQVFVERGGNLDFGTPTIVPTGVRLRSAVQGPDGNLYVATDVGGGGGAIWKVVPT